MSHVRNVPFASRPPRGFLSFCLVAAVVSGLPPPGLGQTTEPLSLADATARALQRLPEVAIQRDAVSLTRLGEDRASAAYDAVIRLDSRLRTRTDPLNTLFVGAPDGALAPRNNSLAGSASWSRLFMSGATVTASTSASFEQTNSRFALLTPAYLTSAGVEFRQPLLAGRRIDAQRRALKVSALDTTRSKAALDRLVSETVAAVERAYWSARATREDVKIREQSLTLAEAQRDDTSVRIEAGVAPEADIAAPRAEIARRRADLVRARDDATRADLALRQLITGAPDAPDWDAAFELTDDPAAAPTTDSIDTLVATALARRPEVSDVEAAREIAAIDTTLARERTRTQLDLIAAYHLRGLAGGRNSDLFVPFPNTTITVPDAQLGGVDDSLQTLATHRFSDVWVGVSVTLPVGRRAAKADLAAATLAERRTELQRTQVAQRIATEVRTAAAALATARERLSAAEALETATTELLEAERARFDTGQSTNCFVLTRQTELAQASLAPVAARIDAARAAMELQRATGQLLERRGIIVDSSPAQTPAPASLPKGSAR